MDDAVTVSLKIAAGAAYFRANGGGGIGQRPAGGAKFPSTMSGRIGSKGSALCHAFAIRRAARPAQPEQIVNLTHAKAIRVDSFSQ